MRNLRNTKTPPRVTAVRHLDAHVVELTFDDGTSGPLDLGWSLEPYNGVMAPLRDVEFFRRVHLSEDGGTIGWPNGVELCPDVLYGDVTDRPIPTATAEWNEERARRRRAARDRAADMVVA